MVKAVIVLNSSEGVSGTVHFTQEGDGPTTVTGSVSGLKPGLHGFHIHALGDTTNGCMSTDHILILLANCMVLLRMRIAMLVTLATSQLVQMALHVSPLLTNRSPLCGPNSIIGRAVVVHRDPDDLGKGGHELSPSTGNAGGRIACGIIGLQG